ncbi:hypothetical protein PBY51_008323 [Eleginops maclovinus]|uniref:Uncharacterized protein n=1 Tax=Eleginops maclovinus TaxID=56733 RepID=A0AAN8AIU5_ELEMC|nr:hypothetical protein PBY51_008323 [Eleginops maclovinus]
MKTRGVAIREKQINNQAMGREEGEIKREERSRMDFSTMDSLQSHGCFNQTPADFLQPTSSLFKYHTPRHKHHPKSFQKTQRANHA